MIDNGIDIADSQANAQKLASFSGVECGLLPPAIRWFAVNNAAQMVAVMLERPPRRQLISFSPAPVSQLRYVKPISFDLPLPWQLYEMHFSISQLGLELVDIKLFFMPRPVDSTSAKLGLCHLPNFYGDGRQCLPGREGGDTPQNLGDAIMAGYRRTWGSGFNMDLHEAVVGQWPRAIIKRCASTPSQPTWNEDSDGGKKLLCKLQAWEEMSLVEVCDIKDWRSPTRGATVGVRMGECETYMARNAQTLIDPSRLTNFFRSLDLRPPRQSDIPIVF